jgi:hypothetical protein
VLVVSEGRIIEDGEPAALAERHGSRYRAMLEAETMVREGLWSGIGWRSLVMQHGQLRESGHEVAT